jgi:hypothetical protein
MSGGQRKRVTFADLVTARLPATPQQPHADQSPKLDTESVDSTTAPEPVAPSPADSLSPPEETFADSSASVSGADLQLVTSAKSPIEEPQKQASPSRSHDDSQPSPDRQSHGDSQPEDVRRTFRPAGAGQTDSQPRDDRQTQSDSQPRDDRQPLKEVKGYLKLPNTIIDSLLPTLDVYEQAVFVQLYRLSQGFGNYTCKVSLPTLQSRTGVKATSLKQAISRLQARGIVEKISAEIGFGREQGITYWVSQDGRQTYGDWQTQGGSQPSHADNKRKDNSKETNKKGGPTPEQIKSCPDCNGVGMWYPEGPGKGVARCYHPSLMRES